MSNVTSLQDCLCNGKHCQNDQKLSNDKSYNSQRIYILWRFACGDVLVLMECIQWHQSIRYLSCTLENANYHYLYDVSMRMISRNVNFKKTFLIWVYFQYVHFDIRLLHYLVLRTMRLSSLWYQGIVKRKLSTHVSSHVSHTICVWPKTHFRP